MKRRAFSTLLASISKINLPPEITELLCKAFKILLALWLTSSSHQIGLSQKTESQSNGEGEGEGEVAFFSAKHWDRRNRADLIESATPCHDAQVVGPYRDSNPLRLTHGGGVLP